MLSYNLKKQIRERFGLKLSEQVAPGSSDLQFLEQPSSQSHKDPRYWGNANTSAIALRHYNREKQPSLPQQSNVKHTKPAKVQKQTLSMINKAVIKLSDKVNKLYSWQISELDLVGRLAGEVQTLKRLTSSSASLATGHNKSSPQNLTSTKLGKILLKSLSESLLKLATETTTLQENCEDSTLSPDNLTSLQNKIAKLSSLESTGSRNPETTIVKNLKENSQRREHPYVDFHASKNVHFVSGDSNDITPHDKLKSNPVGNYNNCLIPQILEGVGKSVLKPTINFQLQANPNSEVSSSVQTKMLSTSKIPVKVKDELNDEISTARMTLRHLWELAADLEGPYLSRFKDFVHMTEKSDMLQPFQLPDILANWLPGATASQVDEVREQTNILQSIKQSIQSFVGENDPEVINEQRLAIQQSGLLDQPLTSRESKG